MTAGVVEPVTRSRLKMMIRLLQMLSGPLRGDAIPSLQIIELRKPKPYLGEDMVTLEVKRKSSDCWIIDVKFVTSLREQIAASVQ